MKERDKIEKGAIMVLKFEKERVRKKTKDELKEKIVKWVEDNENNYGPRGKSVEGKFVYVDDLLKFIKKL